VRKCCLRSVWTQQNIPHGGGNWSSTSCARSAGGLGRRACKRLNWREGKNTLESDALSGPGKKSFWWTKRDKNPQKLISCPIRRKPDEGVPRVGGKSKTKARKKGRIAGTMKGYASVFGRAGGEEEKKKGGFDKRERKTVGPFSHEKEHVLFKTRLVSGVVEGGVRLGDIRSLADKRGAASRTQSGWERKNHGVVAESECAMTFFDEQAGHCGRGTEMAIWAEKNSQGGLGVGGQRCRLSTFRVLGQENPILWRENLFFGGKRAGGDAGKVA